MVVAEHLHLDVAAPLDVALEQHRVVAEGAAGLPARGRDGLLELVGRAHHAHALAAPAGRGLGEDGEGQRGRVLDRAVGPDGVRRHDGDAGGDGDLAGGVLAAHLVHDRGAGADEPDARLLQRGGEGRALGEEAVAGVDGVGPGGHRGRDDLVDVEVGGDRDRVVGGAHVGGVGVEVGEDRDGADAQAGGGPHHAAGDLAAVGDEQAGDGTASSHPEDAEEGAGTGAWAQAASAMPSTRRVSVGSMTPSSQRRAVA